MRSVVILLVHVVTSTAVPATSATIAAADDDGHDGDEYDNAVHITSLAAVRHSEQQSSSSGSGTRM